MGWFRKKEAPLRLHVSEVEGWLASFEESVGLDVHLSTFNSRLKRLSEELRQELRQLADSQLPDGLESGQQLVVKEHLKALSKRLELFAERLQPSTDRSKVSEFVESFSDRLSALQDALQPDLFALQEFLPARVKAVRGLAGSLDDAVVQLRRAFERVGVERFDEVYRRMEEYRRALSRRKELQEAIEKEERGKKEPSEKLEKIRRRVAELQASNGFRFIVEREEELQRLADEKERLSLSLRKVFKPFKEVLDKCKGADRALVESYIKHPLKALSEDEELAVAACVQKLQKAIRKPDEKLDQSLVTVDEKWLSKRRQELERINGQAEAVKASLKRDTTRMLISEQLSWERSASEHLARIDGAIEAFRAELEPLSPQLLVQRVRDALRVLRKDVEVRL